jgi:hypothetical protein
MSSISTLLGSGDGTFQPHITAPAGMMPMDMLFSVAVADFDQDGHADLAASQLGSVTVLGGMGDGHFQPWASGASYPVPGQAMLLEARDLNADGHFDLIVPNQSGEWVRVLLGKPGGTFDAAVEYAAGSAPISVAIEDFNGDGRLDLGVANFVDIRVLVGNGDGTFQAATAYPAGDQPRAVTAADFNGDGHADLAAANVMSNDMSVLVGNGDGTFQPGQSYPCGNAPRSIGAGDFNGDQAPDIAVVNTISNDVSIFIGKGDGTFEDVWKMHAGGAPNGLVVADFNADGKPDLATANELDRDVFVFLNTSP